MDKTTQKINKETGDLNKTIKLSLTHLYNTPPSDSIINILIKGTWNSLQDRTHPRSQKEPQ